MDKKLIIEKCFTAAWDAEQTFGEILGPATSETLGHKSYCAFVCIPVNHVPEEVVLRLEKGGFRVKTLKTYLPPTVPSNGPDDVPVLPDPSFYDVTDTTPGGPEPDA